MRFRQVSAPAIYRLSPEISSPQPLHTRSSALNIISSRAALAVSHNPKPPVPVLGLQDRDVERARIAYLTRRLNIAPHIATLVASHAYGESRQWV